MHDYEGYVVFLFFFSSRRRHTRCSRDWSSDVCSSDLDSLDISRLNMATGWPPRMAMFSIKFSASAVFPCEGRAARMRSEEHTSELQSRLHLVCRLLLEKKKKKELCHTRSTDMRR